MKALTKASVKRFSNEFKTPDQNNQYRGRGSRGYKISKAIPPTERDNVKNLAIRDHTEPTLSQKL